MKHYNITVLGKVQGVFYRQSTLEIAKQLGLKGFVRNEPDGNVYIEAEGSEDELNKFIAWCWKGPELAKVEDLRFTNGKTKNFTSFEIQG